MKRQLTKMLFMLFSMAVLFMTDVCGQMVTVLPNDAGTSANGRSPSNAWRRIRSIYLIKQTELAAAGFGNGSQVGQIGWTYIAASTAGAATGPLIVYLQNTTDVTNLKSTTWATAISGMTVVHNATTTLAGTTTPDIVLTGGSPFTYTGGGVYVAFDWGCYTGTLGSVTTSCNFQGLTNGLLGAQSTAACPGAGAATVAASNFRPETRFGPPLVPCSGTPAPGNTVSSVGSSACTGSSFTLSLQTTTNGTGVSYQWQSDIGGGFSNIAGATNATLTTSQTVATTYQCLVTCSGNTGQSNPLLVTMNTDLCACNVYCASTHTSGCGTDAIVRVRIPGTSLDNNTGCSTGSYQFYNGGGSQTASLVMGTTYSLELTFGTDPNQFSAFWIDYNNNGLFTDANEFIATSAVSPGASGTTTFSFTVPGAVSAGTHRMRIIGGNDLAVGNTPCGASSDVFGETEDYCITLLAPVACSGTPVPGTVVSSKNPACSGADFTLSLTGTTVASGLTYQWEKSTDNITYNPISNATNASYVANITVQTWFRCVVTCSGNSATTTSLLVTASSATTVCYCLGTTSLAGCTYGLDIENVTVAGINNNSSCGGSLPNMYTDFSYISGVVEQGLSYSISISRSSFVNNAIIWGVWVDWNNDFDFLDAGEYSSVAAAGGAGTGSVSGTGTISVPATASLGGHLMRIRANFSTDPGQTTVCANYANPSEQEDYTLNVVTACSGTPVAGNTNSFSTLACPNVPFTLYLTGVGAALNLTYQWESSPDNITYTPVAGATNSSLVIAQQVPTWYHCVVTCTNSGQSASSVPLQMNNNTYANCICTTPVYSSAGCTGTTANDYIGQVTFAGINNTTGCGATTPFYQFFPGQIANVNQTVTYPITVSAPAAGAAFQRFKVYIDFNDNASFDDVGETVFNSGPISTSANSASGNISIAANAPLGTHLMRVRSTNPLSTNIDANSCSDDGYFGEVEDYTVVVAGPPPCSGTPAPGLTLASTPLACSSTTITLSLQNATSGTGVTYQWQSASDALFTTPVNLGNNSTQTATQSASTWYRCIVTCSGNNGTSTPVLVSSSSVCYCTNPVHGSDGCALGLYIDNFTFAGINNTSGCYQSVPYTTPFYSYFPNQTANVDLGVTYPISITTPVNAGSYFNHFAMWIDFNNNGSFDDAGEAILSTALGSTTLTNTMTGNYTIPNTAPPGTHKLRIRSGNSDLNWTSCAAASSGETEDYNIIIAPPATSASSNTPVCTNGTINLSALPNGATSYSWTGPNSFTSSAQNPSITNATALAAGTYTVTMVIFGFTYTATTTVAINPLPSVSASASAPFCEGTGNLTLTATAPTATLFSWSGPGTIVNGNTAIASVLSAPASASGLYSVTVTDGNGCTNTGTVSALVWALPPVLITPIGSTNLCTGQTTTDLQASGAITYIWSTAETTSLITVSTLGNYTVSGIDGNGCQNTDLQVITESTPPAAPVISPSGTITLCTDGFTTTSTNLSVTNYSTDLIWSSGETSQTIVVNYPDVFNVTYTDGNGCFSVSNVVTTLVDNISTAPTGASSNAAFNNICLGNTVTLSVDGGSLGDNAQWIWYETGCGSGAPVGSGPSITLTPATPGTHNYFVRSESVSCGNTGCATIAITVSPALALGTVHYTAIANVGCNNSTGTFSVNAVPGAAYYNWSGTAGTLFNGSPGPVQTLTPTVLVTFATPPPAGASGYSICCFAGNSCSSSNSICHWVRAKVSQPSVISGTGIACANTNGTYSVPVVTGADTYTWTVTGAAGINGGGASLTTASNSITVNFGPAWTTGTLSVYASLNCGFNSTVRSMSITQTPAQPGVISGPTNVCPNGVAAFSIAAVSGAASYTWSCSVPGAIVTPSSNTCSISFPASIPAGSTVSVAAVSGCGSSSALRSKGIASGLPGTPGNITGPATGNCGINGVSFAVSVTSAGATSYSWSITGGASIQLPNTLSGVAIDFPSNFSSGLITVNGVNSCGNGIARTLTVYGAPALPGPVSGNAAPCANGFETYSTAGSSGATSYNWTVPAGATILSTLPYGTSILVQLGSTGGSVKVAAVNDCGSSAFRSFPVTISCRMSQVEESAGGNVNVFPNPTNGNISISFNASADEHVSMNVTDLTGRIVMTEQFTATSGLNVHDADLSKLAKGVYLVHLSSATMTEKVKLTVE